MRIGGDALAAVDDEEGGSRREERFRIYAAITVVLIVCAVVASLATGHRQSGLKGCLGITLSGYRDSCLISLANSTKNASVCSYVSPATAGYCYEEVGKSSLSPKICTLASSELIKNGCIAYIANVTGSAYACSYLNASENSGCVEALATSRSNASICYSMANSTEATICASGVSFGLAENLGDQSYCALVTNVTNANVTESVISLSSYVSYGRSENLSLAFSNPADYLAASNLSPSARNVCYYSVASRDSNSSICGGISNLTLKDECVSSIAPQAASSNSIANYTNNGVLENLTKNATGLYAGCAKIYGQANATACAALVYTDEAVTTENATLCTYINSTIAEYQCYSSLAQAYGNANYCGYIKNFTYNEACVGDLNYNKT